MAAKMADGNLISWTARLFHYLRRNQIEDALHLFEHTANRPRISWNMMLSGLLQNCRTEEGRQLFDKIPCRNTASWNCMIAAYARCGRMDEAQELFLQMPDRNNFSWSTMVFGCCQNGRVDEARQLFDKMPRKNALSWNAMVRGYCQIEQIEKARRLFDKMPQRYMDSCNAIIAGYGKIGRLDDAKHLFDEMPRKPFVSWRLIISAHVQNQQSEEGLKVYRSMVEAGFIADTATFGELLRGCASLGLLEEGKQLHAHVAKSGAELNCFLGSSLLSMYAGCGLIEDALFVFRMTHAKTVESWNAIILGLAYHGLGSEALEIFADMQESGVKPNDCTFSCVMLACVNAGLVKQGISIFEYMVPKAEHYALLIGLKGRAGKLEEASRIIRRAKCKPVSPLWRALLCACRSHGNIRMGITAAEKIFELDPENPAAYMLLSTIYGNQGLLDDAKKLRIEAMKKGYERLPSCSWIICKNKVHNFRMNDKSHEESEKIHAVLESLHIQIRLAGYNKCYTNVLLHDVEEETDEKSINQHSEKLAIAFGHIVTPAGQAIRIFRNFRMCNDCHLAVKFMARVLKREIIVRDQVRFHCFKDGSCSCGDYW